MNDIGFLKDDELVSKYREYLEMAKSSEVNVSISVTALNALIAGEIRDRLRHRRRLDLPIGFHELSETEINDIFSIR